MPKPGGKDHGPASDEARSREAHAALDSARHQAGGALTGHEVRKRWKLEAMDDPKDPPLDWRPTPRNLFLQALAVALFVGIVWFLIALVTDSLEVLFG